MIMNLIIVIIIVLPRELEHYSLSARLGKKHTQTVSVSVQTCVFSWTVFMCFFDQSDLLIGTILYIMLHKMSAHQPLWLLSS